MNPLIPALLAILFAEIGGPLAIFTRRRPNIVAFFIALLICVGAAVGATFTDIMTIDARTLMLGIVLILAGTGQFERIKPRTASVVATGLTLWRSPAPFLAFALTAWSGTPVSVALGGLLGIGVAAGAAIIGVNVSRPVRIAAGVLLIATGVFAALRGLHLI